MALPPPLHDPAHIETRLLVVAEMLENAVAEVRRTMAEIRAGLDLGNEPPSEGRHAAEGGTP